MHFVIFTLLLSTLVALGNADLEYVLKPTGDLYFSDTQYALKFDLSLNSYYSNAKLLHFNTLRLEEKCKMKNNSLLTDCEYFHDNFKNVSDMAIREMNYVKTNVKTNRKKRELICMALAMFTVSIISVIAGFFAGVAISSAVQKEIIEQSNIQNEITPKQFDIDEKMIKITNKSTNVLSMGIGHLTDAQYINQLLLSSLLALDKHHRDTTKYFNVLNDDVQSGFFNIIDIMTFQEAIQNIKEKEKKFSPILSLKPHEIIKMSNLNAEFLNDTIRINVFIPLTSGEKFTLYSFTPVPIKRDDNSFILNSDAKYFIQNSSTIREISIRTLISCLQISKLSICDEILSYNLSPLNECLSAKINHQSSNALCTYRPLPHQNQIIRISEDFLYIYIVEPMSFKIACGNGVKIYNLTHSLEIDYGKHCKFSTETNYHMEDELSTLVTIESKFIEPNFSVLINATWKNVEFLNQHNIETGDLYHEVNVTSNYFYENSKILTFSDMDFLSFIPNFIFNEMVQFAILYIVLPLSVIILLTCCIFRRRQ